MKTIILKFKYRDLRGVSHSNLCTVKIEPAKNGEPSQIKELIFSNEVKSISYSDFTELYHNIQVMLDEETQTEATELTVVDIPGTAAIVKPGALDKFENGLKNMFSNLKKSGKLNDKEIADANKAFELVDRFLGRKK